jgi:hypothetical protein
VYIASSDLDCGLIWRLSVCRKTQSAGGGAAVSQSSLSLVGSRSQKLKLIGARRLAPKYSSAIAANYSAVMGEKADE